MIILDYADFSEHIILIKKQKQKQKQNINPFFNFFFNYLIDQMCLSKIKKTTHQDVVSLKNNMYGGT